MIAPSHRVPATATASAVITGASARPSRRGSHSISTSRSAAHAITPSATQCSLTSKQRAAFCPWRTSVAVGVASGAGRPSRAATRAISCCRSVWSLATAAGLSRYAARTWTLYVGYIRLPARNAPTCSASVSQANRRTAGRAPLRVARRRSHTTRWVAAPTAARPSSVCRTSTQRAAASVSIPGGSLQRERLADVEADQLHAGRGLLERGAELGGRALEQRERAVVHRRDLLRLDEPGGLGGARPVHREVTADAGEHEIDLGELADGRHVAEHVGVTGVIDRRPALDGDHEAARGATRVHLAGGVVDRRAVDRGDERDGDLAVEERHGAAGVAAGVHAELILWEAGRDQRVAEVERGDQLGPGALGDLGG